MKQEPEIQHTLGTLSAEIQNIKEDITPLQQDMQLLSKSISEATYKLTTIADSVVKLTDKQSNCTMNNIEKHAEFQHLKSELRTTLEDIKTQYKVVNDKFTDLDTRLKTVEQAELVRVETKKNNITLFRLIPTIITIGSVLLAALTMYLNNGAQ